MVKRKTSLSQAALRKRQASTTSALASSNSVAGTPGSKGRSETPSSVPSTPSTSSTATFKTASESKTDVSGRATRSSGRLQQSTQSTSSATITQKAADSSPPAVVTCDDIKATGLSTPPIVPESSHEETIISPYVANNQQNTACSLAMYTPTDTYPVFDTGNIFIECHLVTPPKQWRLHSVILDRHSAWFRSAMRTAPRHSEQPHSSLFFLLEEHDGNVTLVLQEGKPVPKNNDNPCLAVHAGATQASLDTEAMPSPPASISSSPSTSTSASTAASTDVAIHVADHQARTDLVGFYNQIFGSFYSIPLQISSDNLPTTMAACESLVKFAHDLVCVPLIAAQITTTLQHHRHALFTAIASDPARYLLLAMRLENDSIYTESLIHIIGAHPNWPWPTKRTVLPPEITKLVVRKSEELDRLCTDVERELLLLTIQVHNRSVEPLEHTQFDTWFTVQVFRDTLARTFHGLDTSASKSVKRGTLFRKIRRGGAEYMPYEEVRRLMSRIMPSAVENLEEDLGLLKDFASEMVEEVAKNEALVDVEREKVGWLTCATIGKEDIPWRADGEKEGGVV